jgi:hypothetical protein
MKTYARIILLVAAIGTMLLLGLKAVEKHQNIKSHNRQFYTAQRKAFLAEIDRRDRINDPAAYTKEKQETAQRYEQSNETEQVIWGKLVSLEGMKQTPPLRMSIRRKAPQGDHYTSIVVDDQMRFAFPRVDPGTYSIILNETSNHPGMRLEEVIIEEGQLLEEMLIEIGDIMVEVTVLDEHGKPVKDAQVSVGKSDGGTNPDLYAWRQGLTDDAGEFIAENLTDGKYVLAARTHTRNGSSVISLTNDKPSKEVLVLTHDNW